MVSKILLTIIYQNEHYITYNKTKASFTFTVRDALLFIFFVTIDVFILNTNKGENFIGFIVRVINQRY